MPAAVLAVLTLATGLFKVMDISTPMSLFNIITGIVMTVICTAAVIFARIKKMRYELTGFFLYLAFAVMIFVICFALRIAGEDTSSWIFNVFYFLTAMLKPVSLFLEIIIGVSDFFRRGLILAILALVTGTAVRGIISQQKFEAEKEAERAAIKHDA